MLFLIVFFLSGLLFGFCFFIGRYDVESRIYYFKDHLMASVPLAFLLGLVYSLVAYFFINKYFIGLVSFLLLVFIPIILVSLGVHLKAQRIEMSEIVVSFFFLFGSFLAWFSLTILVLFSYLSYINITSTLHIILGVLLACWIAYVLNIMFVAEASLSRRATLSLPPAIASPSAVNYAHQIIYGSEIIPPIFSLLILIIGVFVLLTIFRG